MIQLSRDEMETHISQTAEERMRGVWRVGTDDPYWIRRLDEKGRLMSTSPQTPFREYEIEHRQITLRSPSTAFSSLIEQEQLCSDLQPEMGHDA